jgi:hypothetical protein
MKALVLAVLVCLGSFSFAQNIRVDGVAIARSGYPAPGAIVGVCTQTAVTGASESGATVTIVSNLNPVLGANVFVSGITPAGYNGTFTVTSPTSGNATQFSFSTAPGLTAGTVFGSVVVVPCTNPVALCSSVGDSGCTSPNPVTADGLGNYFFYVKAGLCTASAPCGLQIYGSGLQIRSMADQSWAWGVTTGVPNGVAKGSALVSNGVSQPSVYQSKPVIDVRDYGATCTGIAHDDTTSIQAAVTAAGNGGVVYIPRSANGCYVSYSIQAVTGITFYGEGENSKLIIPSAGWAMLTHVSYGIINIYNVNNVRITGLHLIGNGAGGVDALHTPKLIYLDTFNNVQIDHNEMEAAGCEGIWEGGNQASDTNLDIGDNYLHDMETQSGFNACNLIPAIQSTGDHVLVHDNRLRNVGTGIGFSVAHGAATGNTILNPNDQCIGTGDSTVNGVISITGNVCDLSQNTVTGFALDGGSTTDNSVSVTGNSCLAHGSASVASICFKISTSKNASLTGNFATVNYKGTCFLYQGSTAGTVVNSAGNTCQGQAETAPITGFAYNPNGGGQTLTVLSTGDKVYGITRAIGSSAFTTNGISGTLNLAMTGDVQSQGHNTLLDNTYGFLDGKPFDFYGTGITAVNPPLTPNNAWSTSQGGGQFYTAGSAGFSANGLVACLSANNTVIPCPTSSVNPIGISYATPGNAAGLAIQTYGYSLPPVAYDATFSPSAGWFACTSATTAGKVTAQSAACATARQVGIILAGGTNVTSGNVLLRTQ